jgi:hypothetical protein
MLTPKQEAFAQQYLVLGNASAAYRVAYPRSVNWAQAVVHNKASLMLRHGEVMVRLGELRSVDVGAAVMEYREAMEAASTIARDPLAAPRDRLNAIGLLAKLQGWVPPARVDLTSGGEPIQRTEIRIVPVSEGHYSRLNPKE